jgi:putative flippase GtrA
MTIFNRIKRNIPKLFKFGIVGSVGALINFFIYFLASEILHLSVNMSAILAFCVAVSNNYVLNHLWTFRAENESNSVNVRQFVYYLFGNIQGLIINLIVLNLVIFLAGINAHYWGQGLGILLGMLSNFIFAKAFVFNRRLAK